MSGLTTRRRGLAEAALAAQNDRTRRLTDEQKLIIIELINQRKDVLFEKRYNSRSLEAKTIAWQEIIDECLLSYGFEAVTRNRGVEHLRNHVWGDMKHRVMKMLKEGNTDEFTKIDEAVLRVLGNADIATESPNCQSVPEPFTRGPPQAPLNMSRLTSTTQPPTATFSPEARQRTLENGRTTLSTPPTAQRGLYGLLPVVDAISIGKRPSGSIDMYPVSLPQKRSRWNGESEDEDAEETQEIRHLRKQLLMEKVRHYQLLNEKLQLEIESMR